MSGWPSPDEWDDACVNCNLQFPEEVVMSYFVKGDMSLTPRHSFISNKVSKDYFCELPIQRLDDLKQEDAVHTYTKRTNHFGWSHNRKILIETYQQLQDVLGHIRVIKFKGAEYNLSNLFAKGWQITVKTNVYTNKVRVQLREPKASVDDRYGALLVQTELTKDEFDFCEPVVAATMCTSERNQFRKSRKYLEEELEPNDIPWLLDLVNNLMDVRAEMNGESKKPKKAVKKEKPKEKPSKLGAEIISLDEYRDSALRQIWAECL